MNSLQYKDKSLNGLKEYTAHTTSVTTLKRERKKTLISIMHYFFVKSWRTFYQSSCVIHGLFIAA